MTRGAARLVQRGGGPEIRGARGRHGDGVRGHDAVANLRHERRDFGVRSRALDQREQASRPFDESGLLGPRGELLEPRERLRDEVDLFLVFVRGDDPPVLDGFGVVDADVAEHVENELRLLGGVVGGGRRARQQRQCDDEETECPHASAARAPGERRPSNRASASRAASDSG